MMNPGTGAYDQRGRRVVDRDPHLDRKDSLSADGGTSPAGIRVAEDLTVLPPAEVLREKLHRAIETGRGGSRQTHDMHRK